jgi:hypothetical protein
VVREAMLNAISPDAEQTPGGASSDWRAVPSRRRLVACSVSSWKGF